MRRYATRAIGIALGAFFWEVLAAASADTQLIPHGSTVLRVFADLIVNHGIAVDIASTLQRTLLSFVLATGLGVPTGLLVGTSMTANALLGGWITFGRAIPAFVLLPLFLTVTRDSELSRIIMAAFGCFVIATAYTAMGASSVLRTRLEVARVYGASRLYTLRAVVLRDAAPQIVDGLRIALPLALVLTLVSEIMLGATHGLGTLVNDSLAGFNLPTMYALVLAVGLVGLALSALATAVSRWLVPYRGHR